MDQEHQPSTAVQQGDAAEAGGVDFVDWMGNYEAEVDKYTGEYIDKMSSTVDLCNIFVKDITWLSDAIRTVGVSQNARRIIVKTAYSHSEGFLWVMKQLAASLEPSAFDPPLSEEEIAFLSDKTLRTDPNTNVVIQVDAKISLKENIKKTKKILRRAKGCEAFDIDLGSTLGQQFLLGVEVRDRLTHPKFLDEMDVSDREIIAVGEGALWLNKSLFTFINMRRIDREADMKKWAADVTALGQKFGVDDGVVAEFIKRVQPQSSAPEAH